MVQHQVCTYVQKYTDFCIMCCKLGKKFSSFVWLYMWGGFIIYHKYSLQHIIWYWSVRMHNWRTLKVSFTKLLFSILCVEQVWYLCFYFYSHMFQKTTQLDRIKMENFFLYNIHYARGIVSENLDLLFFVSISFMSSQIRMEIIHQWIFFYSTEKNLLSFRFLVSMIFEYYIFITEIQIQYFRVGWIDLTDRFAEIWKISCWIRWDFS